MRQTTALALALLAISHTANAAPCESLTSLSLPNVTITIGEPVAAGAFTAPGRGGFGHAVRERAGLLPRAGEPQAHERFRYQDGVVAASRLACRRRVERQVPGHRKRRARGRHGREPESAGSRRSRGIRDGGPQHGARGRLELRADHPAKIKDFGYRSTHEMTVTSKALIKAFYGREARLRTWRKAAAARSRRSVPRSAIPRTTT